MTKSVPIGPLSNRSADNRHWVEPKREFPIPTLFCNAVMPNLTPQDAAKHIPFLRPPARVNCDHSARPSVGGC